MSLIFAGQVLLRILLHNFWTSKFQIVDEYPCFFWAKLHGDFVSRMSGALLCWRTQISLNRAFCKTQANSSPDTVSLYDDWILD